jgi:hypothetical protein
MQAGQDYLCEKPYSLPEANLRLKFVVDWLKTEHMDALNQHICSQEYKHDKEVTISNQYKRSRSTIAKDTS